jgi:hypothetical protein
MAGQNQNWERGDQPKRLRIAGFRLWKGKTNSESEISPAGRFAPSSDFV